MANLYDALQDGLQAMERGADMESVLARYPDQARELRPLLEAALQARRLAGPAPSAESQLRGRTRLMQRASALRAKRRPTRRFIPTFQRLALAFGLAGIFLASGTGLVQASSTSLPGDNLYQVKRTWEDVRLLFVFDPQHREVLESDYEQERLQEVTNLLQKGRSAPIMFSGVVTNQQDTTWTVSGVTVLVSIQTQSNHPAAIGSAVTIIGQTQPNGAVLAMQVQLLPPGSLVPVGESEHESESSNQTQPGVGSGNATQASSGNESENQSQEGGGGSQVTSFHLTGTIQSIQNNVWTVNGRTVYVDQAQIKGAVTVGAQVELKGYFAADGRFIVTKAEIKAPEKNDSQKNDSGSNSGDSNGGNGEGGDTESGDH